MRPMLFALSLIGLLATESAPVTAQTQRAPSLQDYYSGPDGQFLHKSVVRTAKNGDKSSPVVIEDAVCNFNPHEALDFGWPAAGFGTGTFHPLQTRYCMVASQGGSGYDPDYNALITFTQHSVSTNGKLFVPSQKGQTASTSTLLITQEDLPQAPIVAFRVKGTLNSDGGAAYEIDWKQDTPDFDMSFPLSENIVDDVIGMLKEQGISVKVLPPAQIVHKAESHHIRLPEKGPTLRLHVRGHSSCKFTYRASSHNFTPATILLLDEKGDVNAMMTYQLAN